jgi:large subunit ribosomal protein L14e
MTDSDMIHLLFDSIHFSHQQPTVLTGVARQTIPLRNLSLTAIRIENLPRAVRVKTLIAAFKKQDILTKYKATNWAKKAQRQQIRAGLSDFDRFKVMVAKKTRNSIISREVAKLKRGSTGKKGAAAPKGKPAVKKAAK